MPDSIRYQIPQNLHRIVDVGAFHLRNRFDTSASGTTAFPQANGDYLRLFVIAAPLLVEDAVLAISATLGVSCTLQAFRNRSGTRVAFTAASTAAAANRLPMTGMLLELAVGDIIELLIAGAAVTAVATVDVTLTCSRL